MAKIYERFLCTMKLRENRRDSFDPPTCKSVGRGHYLFGYFAGNTACDSFFYYMIDLLRLFQTRRFVLSRKHQNQNLVTIGTLLDQFKLSCK